MTHTNTTNIINNISNIINNITPTCKDIEQQVLSRFHSLATPLDSLGKLQDNIVDICKASHSVSPDITKRALVVFCADNGVVNENISQVGSDVTTAVAKSLCNKSTVMCKMAEFSKIDVIPVDIGMKVTFDNIDDFVNPLIKASIMPGTNNIKDTFAMTRNDAIKAIEVGISIAIDLHSKGYNLLATGEMGIGNTTTSTAMTCVLLDLDVDEITGAGSGLSKDGIQHKKSVIKQAIKTNNPNKNDILDVLSKVGGLDIAGMIGLMLGCSYCKIPCIVDGFISNVSALSAIGLCENVKDYLIFSHVSDEKGGQAILNKLNIAPILNANMRLGEGSGAVALIPLLDMGFKIYNDTVTFTDMQIPPYIPL